MAEIGYENYNNNDDGVIKSTDNPMTEEQKKQNKTNTTTRKKTQGIPTARTRTQKNPESSSVTSPDIIPSYDIIPPSPDVIPPSDIIPSSMNESHIVLITDDNTGNYVANTVYIDKGNDKYEKYVKEGDNFTNINKEYIIDNLQGTIEQTLKTGEQLIGGKKTTRRNRRKKIRRSKTLRRRSRR